MNKLSRLKIFGKLTFDLKFSIFTPNESNIVYDLTKLHVYKKTTSFGC